MNKVAFASAVLHSIGAPVTHRTVAGFIGWAKAEGGDNWSRNNPLNTTEGGPGVSGTINSAGVKAYVNPEAGIRATATTLKNGNYGGIIHAFRSNNPLGMPLGELQTWGTGALALQTIRQTLGQNFNLQNASAAGIGRQMASPGTPGHTLSTHVPTSSTHTDTRAAVANALLAQSSTPVPTDGTVPVDDALQQAVNAIQSGAYTTTTHGSKTISTNVPGTPGQRGVRMGVTPGAGDVNPIAGFNIGRTDMGVDASAHAGAPIRALNDSKVVQIVPDWYSGQPLVLMRLMSGPNAGKLWYVAEQISGIPHVGEVIRRGQTVARFAPSGTGIEIGWGSTSSSQRTLAGETGYSEGQVTPAGASFAHLLAQLRRGKL